jgi:hypothetical protein
MKKKVCTKSLLAEANPTVEKVNTCILLETTAAWDDWPPIRLYDGCKKNKKEK